MSTTDASCLGLGGEEGIGEDNSRCDDGGCDNDGCDNGSCKLFWTLFEGLPP